jgi:hypothetical protein
MNRIMNPIMSFTSTTSIIIRPISTIQLVGMEAGMGKECIACQVVKDGKDGTILIVKCDYARRKSLRSFSFFYFDQPFIILR